MERDTSVTRMIVACSLGTATVACGRASASASAASEIRNSPSGMRRRQAPADGTSGASVGTPGKRMA